MNTATQNELIRQVRAARAVSVPIVSIATPDQPATRQLIAEAINGDARHVIWDVVEGVRSLKDAEDMLGAIPEQERKGTIRNPVAAFVLAKKFGEGTVMYVANAQRFLSDAQVIQAICNLRDVFTSTQRMIILLGPEVPLPPELQGDVVELDEPLPDDEELQKIVRENLTQAADQGQIEFTVEDDVVDAAAAKLRGTPSFGAKQLSAMAIRKHGFDQDSLDTQAKKLIEQTKGLLFERGTETFDDIGGLEFIKTYGKRLFAGPCPPRVIVRVEEIEKTMQGSKGDLSGTSSDAMQVLLSEFEDNGWSGLLAYGAAGAGKSLFAKSLANSHGARAIRFDMNACKGSLVGESERQIRAAMKVIKTIGGSDVFFVASLNKIDDIPPELQRRFRAGVWFFDIPNAKERKVIWSMNRKAFGILAEEKTPKDENLTGADIRNICETAYKLNCTLSEAMEYVTPLKVQSPEAIADARTKAAGKFKDANLGGMYTKPEDRKEKQGRRIDLH